MTNADILDAAEKLSSVCDGELPFCECGCGLRVTKPGNRFRHGHHARRKLSPEEIEKRTKSRIENKNKPIPEPQLCECGCGEYALPGNRFIHGHHMRGIARTPEHSANLSKAKLGIPQTPEHNAAVSKTLTGVPHTPEHIAAVSEGLKNSDANKVQIESMRGGDDLVTHHYIYDHNDLSLNTVQMTRSDHMKLHRLLQKLGYKVPHINVKEDKGVISDEY